MLTRCMMGHVDCGNCLVPLPHSSSQLCFVPSDRSQLTNGRWVLTELQYLHTKNPLAASSLLSRCFPLLVRANRRTHYCCVAVVGNITLVLAQTLRHGPPYTAGRKHTHVPTLLQFWSSRAFDALPTLSHNTYPLYLYSLSQLSITHTSSTACLVTVHGKPSSGASSTPIAERH